ncbi:hypothetical protein CLOM_g19950 [Closterium sp. NIES-68]|nr:hypothetical protein CLOM_g19950 [Closterium sp. NIES-68]
MAWQGGGGTRGRGRGGGGRGGGGKRDGRGYGGSAGGGAGAGGAEQGATAEQHALAPRVLLDPSLSHYFTEIASTWQETTDPQARASIAANALEEARGKEHPLLWDSQTCRTLEPLLSAAPPAAAARFLAGACCCAGRGRAGGDSGGRGSAGGEGDGGGEREVNLCRDILAHGLASRVVEAGLQNIRGWVTGERRTGGSAGLDETGAGVEEEDEGEEEEGMGGEGSGGEGDLPKWTGTLRVVMKKICAEVAAYPLAAITSPACSHVLRSLLLLLACRPINDTPAAAEGTRKGRQGGAEKEGGEERREEGGEEGREEKKRDGAGSRSGGRLPPQIQRAAGNFQPTSGGFVPSLPGMSGQGTGWQVEKEVAAAAAAEQGRRQVVVGVAAAAAGAEEAIPSSAVSWSSYGDSWTLACDPAAGPLLQVMLDVIRDDAALLTHVITSLLHLPEASLRAAAKKRKREASGRQEGGCGKKRGRREEEERGEGGDEGDEEGRGGAEGGEEGEGGDEVDQEVEQILYLMKDRCGSRFMETVLLLAPPSLRTSLLRVALLPRLLPLALHPIANYTVQTALSALDNPTDVKRAFKALAGGGKGGGEGGEGEGGETGGIEGGGRGEGLSALLKGGRGRVVLALLIACGRTKTFQTRACESLLAALSPAPPSSTPSAAADTAASDAAAVGSLLWLDGWLTTQVNDQRSNRAKKRQQQQGWASVPVAERGALSFVGCMALQTIFAFPPAASHRVLQALVALPPSHLMHLATDIKGSRVLSAFFRAPTVPAGLKTTMLTSLKPRLSTTAPDKLGAFVVSAAFDAMGVEGKQIILSELATRYSSASSSLLQRPLFRHMGLAEYLESPDAWQKQQQRKEGLLREFQDLLPAPATPVDATTVSVAKKMKSEGKKRKGCDDGGKGLHGGDDAGSKGGGKPGGALRGIVEQLELGSEMAMLGFGAEGGEMGQEEMDGGSVSKKRKVKKERTHE